MEHNHPPLNDNPESPRFAMGIHMGSSNIAGGLILVGIGVLFLLGNLHIIRGGDWVSYWPVILIVIGLVQLVDSTSATGRMGGGVVFPVGALFLADNLGYLHFPIWQLWPVVLIGVGIMMLWNRAGFVGVPRAARKQYERWNLGYIHPDNLTSSGLVHEFTIFGGSKRVVTTQDFRGGKIATIFGGCSLDLTGAAIAGDTAVLYVSALYGGSTIKIPPTWNVEVHGAGIFGGFGDQTIHPPALPGTKQLIVKGAAIFGGVAIKN